MWRESTSLRQPMTRFLAERRVVPGCWPAVDVRRQPMDVAGPAAPRKGAARWSRRWRSFSPSDHAAGARALAVE